VQESVGAVDPLSAQSPPQSSSAGTLQLPSAVQSDTSQLPSSGGIWLPATRYESFEQLYEAHKSSDEIPSPVLLEALRLLRKGLRGDMESWRRETDARLAGLAASLGDIYESVVYSQWQDVFTLLAWPVPSTPPTRNRVFSRSDPAFSDAFNKLASPTYRGGMMYDDAVRHYVSSDAASLSRISPSIELDFVWTSASEFTVCLEATAAQLMVSEDEWKEPRRKLFNNYYTLDPSLLNHRAVNFLRKIFQLERQVAFLRFAFPSAGVRAVLVSPSFRRATDEDRMFLFHRILKAEPLLNEAIPNLIDLISQNMLGFTSL
jgi:hypothetical protein